MFGFNCPRADVSRTGRSTIPVSRSVTRLQTTPILLFLVLVFSNGQSFGQATEPSRRNLTVLFQIAGLSFGLDPSLLEAIAVVESAGRADAVSPKGATGVMQLMPETAKRFGVEHPFDPAENVMGAARFLSYLREYVGIQDLPQLLAAYNAGEGAVKHYDGLPPYPETRQYVRNVLITYLLRDGGQQTNAGAPTSSWHRGQSAQLVTGRLPKGYFASRRTATAQRTNGADVFAQLDQIKEARRRALKGNPAR